AEPQNPESSHEDPRPRAAPTRCKPDEERRQAGGAETPARDVETGGRAPVEVERAVPCRCRSRRLPAPPAGGAERRAREGGRGQADDEGGGERGNDGVGRPELHVTERPDRGGEPHDDDVDAD